MIRASHFRALVLLSALWVPGQELLAQGATAFTYSGQLVLDQKAVDTGGQPGAYDFEFRAFDRAEAEGSVQIGQTVEKPGLPLSEGRFSAQLDFGPTTVQMSHVWIESTVFHRQNGARKVVTKSRQRVTVNASRQGAPVAPLAPATSDTEILARLPAVRVVISDRQTPGDAHFLVDEASFRRAFGVGTPVTPTDLSAVTIVAANQLKREVETSRQHIQKLEAEIGRLRFRINMTLLLLAAVVGSVFLQRRREGLEPPEESDEEDIPSSPEASSPEQSGIEPSPADNTLAHSETAHSEADRSET